MICSWEDKIVGAVILIVYLVLNAYMYLIFVVVDRQIELRGRPEADY